jgi:hypothetical protein
LLLFFLYNSCGISWEITIVGAKEQERRDERIGTAFGPTPGEPGQARGTAGSWTREEGLKIFREFRDGGKGTKTQEEFSGAEQKDCTGTGTGDSPGAQWSLNGKGRGGAAGAGVSRKTYYEWA